VGQSSITLKFNQLKLLREPGLVCASIDEKKLDFQTAFIEIGTGDERNWIKFRAGRHEMEYGSGRLIDVREGPNVRLSFDGFKVKTGIGPWPNLREKLLLAADVPNLAASRIRLDFESPGTRKEQVLPRAF
jgi:hypothetical protein